ncbi:hypothetical protein ACFVZD_01075 [Streptomyces sp. NPDC058287]|uniref:hypothetical protein n=1 Tax=Streptomyces sp. NPDC058287 TaxID=3346423 RepID=UPI0036E67CA7
MKNEENRGPARLWRAGPLAVPVRAAQPAPWYRRRPARQISPATVSVAAPPRRRAARARSNAPITK